MTSIEDGEYTAYITHVHFSEAGRKVWGTRKIANLQIEIVEGTRLLGWEFRDEVFLESWLEEDRIKKEIWLSALGWPLTEETSDLITYQLFSVRVKNDAIVAVAPHKFLPFLAAAPGPSLYLEGGEREAA
ncbi:hypothetical protein [Mesorhizobium sp. SP-1A]|uniref:hypothetical protein n=1 Tax=Mesorhizobium sp. SP-1A TaxID=3077840 RepID=UPI0028F6F476|nr:hypothetical protein [Mesorhizobium sp. SP-1A]